MIIDGHCDTLKECYKRKCFIEDESLSFNIVDAPSPMLQMMAIYISPEEAEKGFEVTSKVLDEFDKQKERYDEKIVQIYSKGDIQKINNDKIGMLLTIENGSAIQGDLSNIDRFYDRGIRMMSIVWNESNELASGALEKNDNGLTTLGIQFVQHLNERDILVDVSHSSVKTFWDVVKITNRPVVASHSCVYELCRHPRNLRDDAIKQIAKMDGIVGIGFCSAFLNEKKKADVLDIVAHIKYIRNLVGIDYVGIGSDFDGLEKEHILPDIKGVRDIHHLEKTLKLEGFSRVEIEKVLGGNWQRVLEHNL